MEVESDPDHRAKKFFASFSAQTLESCLAPVDSRVNEVTSIENDIVNRYLGPFE